MTRKRSLSGRAGPPDCPSGATSRQAGAQGRDDAKTLERKIDDAVEMTFPASDPTAIGGATSTEPPARPANRQAPSLTKEEIERAAAGRG
jgi:hypothetical protein